MFGRFSRKKKKGDVPSASSSAASDAAAAMSPTRSTRSNRGANGGRGGAGRKERRDEERRQRRQREEERRHRKSNRRQRQQRRTDRSDRRGGDGGGGGRGRGEQVRTGARAGAEIRLTGENGSPEREARAARQRTGHQRDGSESPPPVKHGSRPSIENGAASREERPDQYPESRPELRADFEDSSANPGVNSGGVADDEAAMLKSAIIEHAIYLGIDPDTDPELLHIAEESMLAPPPEGWRTMSDDSGNPFYYNETTKVSQWDHPEDNHYREIIQEMKAAKAQNDAITKSADHDADHDALAQKKKKDGNANLSEVKPTETAANTWDDWDDDEEDDGDTGEKNGGSSASTTTTARGERQQQTQTQGANKESEPAVDLDDWDESDEDENVDNAPSAPSSSSTGMPLPLANANEDIDLEESALSKLMRTSPQTSAAARKAQSEQAAQGNGRRAVPTIPEMSDEEEDKEETRATSSVTESSSSSTSRSSSSSSSSSAPQDLSKAYFQAQAEARELRAELARVHAQTAEIRANQIREQKSHASRIDMLMQEIATERGIGAKHSARVFELESNVQSLEKERDFAVQRANDLIKEKEDAKAKEEHGGSEESVETTIAEIEKIAAKAQIAALEAKVKEMEEEADDLEQQTARAMKTARAAQDASRGFEKELAELRGKENAAVAQDKKSNSITDAALKEAEDKHRLEIVELRETQMTAMSNKAEEHARALTKMRSEMLVLKAELAESKAAAAIGNKVDEAEVQKMIEKATVILQAKMKVMAHELDSEKAARMAAEQREQAEKASVEAAAEAAAGEKRSLDSRISAAKAASDRKLRQLEQCLSMAEERADRAEAEAHDAHVESQLAGTLGIKVRFNLRF